MVAFVGPPKGKKKPGPDRRQLWRSAAALMGAVFVQGRRDFDDAIVVDHGPWVLRIETFIVQVGTAPIVHTGARAYFRGLRDLRLSVSQRTLFHRLGEALGFRDRIRLEPGLAEKYVARGKPGARIPSLFAATGLGGALLALPKAELHVKRPPRKARRRHGEDVGEVVCRLSGVRLDAQLLAGLASVVEETLDALERVGEARREPVPGVERRG